MYSRTQKAIVFNCHYNGLSIIQELGQHGVKCIAMDAVRSIGTYSRYAEYQKCPDPTESESAFIEFLYSYCAREKEKPVVFLQMTIGQWHFETQREAIRGCFIMCC